MEFTAEIIAGFLGGEIVGDMAAKVWTISKIEEGVPGGLSFLSNPKYEPYIYETKSTIVIVNKSFEPSAPVSATMIKVDDAYGCFAKLLELYIANKPQKQGVSLHAWISPSVKTGDNAYIGEFAVINGNVKIGNNVKIYPHVYIDDNVKIGDNTTIYSGVKIYEDCIIGSNVVIHSGCVIGADGFGFAPNADGTYSKIPQIGNVIIEDDIEIGANTCIDRATMGSTVVKKGVKLDNLIQLGHNSYVGENTVIAAQFGLAGSSKVGDNCMIGGQVGVAGHLSVGNNVKLGSKTGISASVSDGATYLGYPAMPSGKFHRSNAVFRNLPELSSKVTQLEKEIKRLTELLDANKE